MIFFIYLYDRCRSARAEALYFHQGKAVVVCCFARFDPTFSRDLIHQSVGSIQTAGKRLTHLNDVSAVRFGIKHGVEGDTIHDQGGVATHDFSHGVNNRRGDVPLLRLRQMQQR